MAKYSWFRVYTEIVDDPKMADKTDAQKWDWICLLALARESKKPGVIYLTREALAWKLRRTIEHVEATLQAYATTFNENGEAMLEVRDEQIVIPKFMTRQYDKPSDQPEATRDRQQRSRRCHADVTPMSRESHATDTDTDTDTEEEALTKINITKSVDIATIPDAPPSEPTDSQISQTTTNPLCLTSTETRSMMPAKLEKLLGHTIVTPDWQRWLKAMSDHCAYGRGEIHCRDEPAHCRACLARAIQKTHDYRQRNPEKRVEIGFVLKVFADEVGKIRETWKRGL